MHLTNKELSSSDSLASEAKVEDAGAPEEIILSDFHFSIEELGSVPENVVCAGAKIISLADDGGFSELYESLPFLEPVEMLRSRVLWCAMKEAHGKNKALNI
jgi:hypothetical protein